MPCLPAVVTCGSGFQQGWECAQSMEKLFSPILLFNIFKALGKDKCGQLDL